MSMIKKGISILLAIALIETAALGSMPPAQPVFAAESKNLPSFSDLGGVTGGKDFGSPGRIIIIQDLHCHPQVQKNIGSIIEILDDKFKINNIYLEGAHGDVDIGWLTAIKDKTFSDNIAQKLLESGKLTGAEYYAYKRNSGSKLKGIEDEEIHLANLKRLSQITELQPEITAILSDLSGFLKQSQKQNYGALNRKLASLSGKYRSGKINSAGYYKKLLKYAEKAEKLKSFAGDFNVNTDDYPEILKFSESSNKLKKINLKTVQTQLSRIVNELKSSLPYGAYSEFLAKTNSLSDTGALIKELERLNSGGFIDFGKYKEAGEFISAQNSAADINPIKLIGEERKFLKALQVKASESEKEMLTVIISDMFSYFSDYYTASLASDDYKYLKAFGTENYRHYWQKAAGSHDIYLLDKYDALLEEYYETNINRDKIFTQHIFDGNEPSGINLIVCGGFHTQGLAEEFEEKGVSYTVITPKVTQDAAIADEIYNEMLLSGFKTESFAIALQAISNGGSQKQFTLILETLLADELKRNPNLNKEEFINGIVNKICDIDESELKNGGLTAVYNRPVNEGVKLNGDGSVEVSIFFENSRQKHVIAVNTKETAPYASIFGAKYAKTAPLWEWVYLLPFSIPFLKSSKFKAFLSNTFLRGVEARDINKVLRNNKRLNISDFISSSLLLSAIFLLPQTLPFVIIAYSVFKSLAFASFHQNKFNIRGGAKFSSVFVSSLVTLLPINLILIIAGPAGLAAAVILGIPLQVLLHELYNVWLAPSIAARLHKNYVYTDSELIKYFDDFSEEIDLSDFNKSVPSADARKFEVMLKLFNLNRNKDTVNRILPVLLQISGDLSHKKQSGKIVLRINESISSQLENMDKSIARYIASSESKEDSFNFLLISAQKNKPRALSEIVSNQNIDVRYRLYAYGLLRSSGSYLNENKKRELTEKARRLIHNFEWRKDLGHIYDGTIFYNEELQAYVTAVYLIMVAEHPGFINRESSDVFKTITKARFDARYRNADSSLSFGKDFFKVPAQQRVFPEIIAHELAHIHLTNLKFSPIKKIAILLIFLPENKFTRKLILNLQRAVIHELYADVAGYLLSKSTGRNPENFYNAMLAPFLKNFPKSTEFTDEHEGARIQFSQLIEMLKHDRRSIDYYKFAGLFDRKLRRNIKNSELYFREFFFDLAESYLTREGYKTVSEPEDLQSNDVITVNELLDSFYASIFGGENAAAAPFWEWVYMLPGVSFFVEKGGFAKILSKTFLRKKSEEEIKGTLKTGKVSKIIDAAGIIAFAGFSLSGLGIAGLAAFALTRAIIFSMAHKGFDWKAHWKDRTLISSLVFSSLLFFIPFAVICAPLAFFSINVIPAVAAGLSLNILLHSVYNKYIASSFSLKKASIAAEQSAEEKQSFIAGVIKSKLSGKLGISEEKIEINPAYEIPYGSIGTLAEYFYSAVKLSKAENGNIVSNIPKSFLFALHGLNGAERDEYIETFAENLTALYEIMLKVPADKRDESANALMNALNDNIADFAKTAFLEYAFSSAVTVPSFDEISKLAGYIGKLSFKWSAVNRDLLYFISKSKDLVKNFDGKTRNMLLFQCIEFLGYILQSQTWLSPALYDGQYGFMQDTATAPRYERELAHTGDIDPVFKTILSNHRRTQIIKTKEAALFEYIADRGNRIGSSLILPDSIGEGFKNIDISSLEDKVYSAYILDENETASLLKQRNSRSITDRYFIIDCSQHGDVAAIAGSIDKYNESVSDKLKIKEVLFYNADLKDYVLSDKKFSFLTAYIFDFPKFVTDENSRESVSDLFTNIPAVYAADDGFVLDFGSRLDNFTIHYLYLLMDRESIVHTASESAARRRDSAFPDMETAEEYKKLYVRLEESLKKYNFFDGAKKKFYNTVMENLSVNIKRLNYYAEGKYVSARDFNDIIDEYRTFLNFLLYFQWSDRKDRNHMISDAERSGLAGQFNGFMIKPKNSAGVPFSQDTVLTASGMSAVKTIAAMLISENISKIALGKNIYYENKHMFKNLNAFTNPETFKEGDTAAILNLDSEAVFFDLISNDSEIPVADVKRVVSELAKRKYGTPFYLCIDNSMYPSFQFNGIFDGIDLPDNMYIVIYGSMQKMHQRGLEIVTSGFLTLMSNGHNHEEILNRLKDSSKFTSSEIDTFRHIALSEFADRDSFLARSKELNDNAEAAALALNGIAKIFGNVFRVYHPSLYSGEQKRMWEENGSAGIPFFFIKGSKDGVGNNIDKFLEYLFKKFIKETAFSPLVRDSYGFDSFTNITYGYGDRAARFNAGLDMGRDADKFLDTFAGAAFEYFSRGGAEEEGTAEDLQVERIYSYVKEQRGYRAQNSDQAVYEYVNGINHSVLSDENVLKMLIICGILEKSAPEEIKARAYEILSGEITVDLSGIYIEALPYYGKPNREVTGKLTEFFINGSSSQQGAAAASLAAVLEPPAVEHSIDGFDSGAGYSGRFIANMLAAA
ncbi:MAG: hypothetical protein LBR69_01820 [Endomicrobium sp.]|jgi:cystathionine beta-lyase/cystathionine gamma-synthase|nr:hypothetical protein [Endomicrobium sp.]